MSNTPFRDKAREVAESLGGYMEPWYQLMEQDSGRSYSGTSWKNLVENGPWDGDSGRGNIQPPSRERLSGIAELFETSPEHVAKMIAADWYGVVLGIGVSDRVKKLIPLIDRLSDKDSSIVVGLLRDGVTERTVTLVRLVEGLDDEDASFVVNMLRPGSERARNLVRLIDGLSHDGAELAEVLIRRLSGEEGEE